MNSGGVSSGVWTQRFVGLVALLTGCTTAALVLLGGYIPKVREQIFFYADDGWCQPAGYQPLGVHCFGDYGHPVMMSQQINPWTGTDWTWPYSASLAWMFRAFSWLGDVTSPTFAFWLYMTLLFVSVTSPGWWAIYQLGWSQGSVVLGLMTIMTYPLLQVIERGSSLGFTVPPVLLASIGFVRRRPEWVLAGGVVASLARPQYVVLLLLLPLMRQWRWFGYSLGAFVVCFLAPYVAWNPGHSLDLVGDYLAQVRAFSTYQSLEDGFPSNYSASRFVVLLAQVIATCLGISRLPLDATSQTVVTGPGLLIAAITVLAVFLGRRTMPPILALAALLSLTMLFPSVSGGYYAVFALVLAAVLMASDGPGHQMALLELGWPSEWIPLRWPLILAVALTLAPGLIPGSESLGKGNLYSSLVAGVWIAFAAALLWISLNQRGNTRAASSDKGEVGIRVER